jgi:HPt (histidine-containing phosphotransfer) domain-containing protein
MTANALDGDDERCLAAGMDDYLSKPVKVAALHQKLERWTNPGVTGASDSVLSDRHPEFSRLESAVVAANGKRRGDVIDRTQLVSLRAIQEPGEADLVTELIDLFLSEASSHLEALHEAVLRNDVVEIQRVAHRLQGSSANLGAMQMSALSQALDTSDPSEVSNGLLAQLEIEFELVREALNAERRELEADLVTPLAGT